MLACFGISLQGMAMASPKEDPISFRSQVAPLVLEHCVACHGAKKAEGGYRMDSFGAIVAGGDTGQSPIVAGDVDGSELYQRLIHEDDSLRMPAESESLAPAEIALVAEWIRQGAKLDDETESDRTKNLLELLPVANYPLPEEPKASDGTANPNRAMVPITALCFSPDGKELIVGGYHHLGVWDIETAQWKRRIGNVMERVTAIHFLARENQLVIAGGVPGRLGEARVYDWATGNLITALGRSNDWLLDLAFHPDGDRYALAGADGSLRVFRRDGELLKSLGSHADAVHAVAWSHDGKRLASASRDKTAKVYDAASYDLMTTYAEHGQPVRAVAFAPDDASIYSASLDRKVHRWSIDGAKKLSEVAGSGEFFKGVTHGTNLFLPTSGAKIHQLDASSGSAVRVFEGAQDWACCCDVSPDGTLVAAGSFDGHFFLWRVADGTRLPSQ